MSKVFLKNHVESIVWSLLDEVLSRWPEMCKCETCKYDVVALALNQLPPRYVVREAGEVYAKTQELEIQYRVDVIAALTKAIQKVMANPRH